MTRRWAGAIALALVFSACSTAAPEPLNPGEGQPPTPSVSVTASADPAPTTKPEAPAKIDAAKLLTKLDEAKGELRLFQVGGTVLVTEDVNESTDTKYKIYTRVGAVTGGKIAWRKELELPQYSQGIKDIEGTYPDALWLTYVFDYGRSADQVLFESTKTAWVARGKKANYFDFLFESTTLPGGSIVGVTMREMQTSHRLSIVHGVAKPPVVPKNDACGPEGAFISAVQATEKGTLIGLGTCAQRYVAAVWPADKTEGTLHLFDGPVTQSINGPQIFKGRGESAWVWLGDKVSHYRDGSWSALEPGPVLDSKLDLGFGTGGGVELENGELWAYSPRVNVLFRRTAPGVYDKVELPAKVSINGLAVQDGKVLVAASNLLLGQGSGGVDWSQVRLDEKKEKRVIGAQPASPACQSNVVVLYGFTKVTPDDYDFPMTRKALKGQKSFSDVTFAVTREAGQKFFVGLTPTFKRAQALRDVIEKGVQGSSPQIVCAKPEVLRELKIDLATGELAK